MDGQEARTRPAQGSGPLSGRLGTSAPRTIGVCADPHGLLGISPEVAQTAAGRPPLRTGPRTIAPDQPASMPVSPPSLSDPTSRVPAPDATGTALAFRGRPRPPPASSASGEGAGKANVAPRSSPPTRGPRPPCEHVQSPPLQANQHVRIEHSRPTLRDCPFDEFAAGPLGFSAQCAYGAPLAGLSCSKGVAADVP
jgi:hypothetical protein